ncbi:MAG: SRPBCC family protein [Actinomycetota bacterium]
MVVAERGWRTPHRFRFRNVWQVAASPEETYAALCRLPEYPMWWPEVKEVLVADRGGVRVRCRSVLPFDLSFVIHEPQLDPESGVLQARLAGDLEGYSRWTVTGTTGGSILVFDEEVETTRPLLKRLSRLVRPALHANHALMMRHGEAGLRAHLAALRAQAAAATA